MSINFNKTKIICTIGPATDSVEKIVELTKSGMSIARINMSHGSNETKLKAIKNIREAEKIIGYPIPVIADLCGPKLRLGNIKEPFDIKENDEIILTSDDVEGSSEKVSTSYKNLANDIVKGNPVLINDGLIKLEVTDISGNEVKCRVVNGGLMQSRKGINLPGTKLSIPLITEKDKKDIDFGIQNGADFFAMSFVSSNEDIKELKAIILRKSASVPVIAKIERPEAVEDIDAICDVSDAVMIARGDLGVEVDPEEVPLIQKEIITTCIKKNTPVITATQMLESMISSPRPTRAEASDVANAVLDGTDAVMLSAETSVGEYPAEAVSIMKRICMKAEAKESILHGVRLRKNSNEDPEDSFVNTMTRAVCTVAVDTNAAAIIVITKTGKTARSLSKYRIKTPILAFVDHEETIKLITPVWGVKAELIDNMSDTDSTLERAKELALQLNYLKKGDNVVFVTGIPLLESKRVNMMKVDTV